MHFVSLQITLSSNFDDNLAGLEDLIKQTPNDSFVLAPELALTGYAYDNLLNASLFSKKAIPILLRLSSNKSIAFTLIVKNNQQYTNTLHIFSNKKLLYAQSKSKLFHLGNEDKYFLAGNQNDIKIININGLKIASLICFELRFIALWQKIQGADLIIIPAMWGINRKENFKVLTKSLAIMNQCFVIASNSANKDMASHSCIIDPFGNAIYNDNEILIEKVDLSKIKKMRKYLNIGLKG